MHFLVRKTLILDDFSNTMITYDASEVTPAAEKKLCSWFRNSYLLSIRAHASRTFQISFSYPSLNPYS